MTKFVINIEKIIVNNKIKKDYSLVKEMEDTLTDIYKKNMDNDILENDEHLSLIINRDTKYNINLYENNINLDNFSLEDNILNIKDDLVFTGSYIRTALLNLDNYQNYKKELFITSLKKIDWKNLLSNNYEELDDMFIKKINNYVVYINKKEATSVSQVLYSFIYSNDTNNKYLMRFGMHRNKFYGTPMFILEYNINLQYINKNNSKDNKFVDPIFRTPIDLFNINLDTCIITEDIFNVIFRKDYNKLVNITSYDLNKLKDKITCIEYAIELYVNEECLIISQQLRLIILELLKHVVFKRHPGFYAELLNLKNKDEELFLIITQKEFLELRKNINTFDSITSINNNILEYYIKTDNAQEFYSYIKFISGKIDQDIINNLIKYNPVNIITKGINRNYLSEYNIYKIILLGEQLNYTKLINFNVDIAINFINKIISQCKIKSFFYIYKMSTEIINYVDSNKNNILHKITEIDNKETLIDFIKLIITLDITILNKKNSNGETSLIYHAKNNNLLITEILIDIIKSKNLNDVFKEYDNDNNNIVHILSHNNNNIKLIKLMIFDNLELIDIQNKSLQTPSIIATKNSAEDLFFLYKSLNANLDLTDEYGNSVYHYICLNGLCIGMMIDNIHNIFGYRPYDYCKISDSYYCFINK
jgi:hypothetical protein